MCVCVYVCVCVCVTGASERSMDQGRAKQHPCVGCVGRYTACLHHCHPQRMELTGE